MNDKAAGTGNGAAVAGTAVADAAGALAIERITAHPAATIGDV
jgi:hypothetical protein